ncbi:MAG TPA: serine/threonine-protein kinase [Pseudomonas sp.]|nr:serine/threonine-protein kinase [Pseudomonas sp.]
MSDSALQIPGYILHGPLGKGGMAEVHLATQQSLQRKVAIKILSKSEDEAFIQRFIKEGHLVASLHHPSIITIYDIDQLADGRHYLAMEFLAGGDLAQHKGELFAPERALAIVRQIASGLAVVHDKGLVHRDVKPANILFRGDGTAVLTDFGVAKDLDLDSELTQFGVAVGSPAYSSPEQAQCLALDARSDIYSLGVILLEMLTGSNPFRGANYTQTVMNHVQMPAPTLPAHLAGCQALLERMLAKDPQQRFPDCRTLLAALDAVDLSDPDETRIGPGLALSATREPEQAAPAPVARPRKSRLPLLLVGLGLLVALAAGGLYWKQQQPIRELLAKADRSLQEGRLLEPAQNNADYFFHEVLRLDQRNPAARAGLERVRQARIKGLLELGEQRLKGRQLVAPAQDSAEYYFNQVLALDAGNAGAQDGLRRVLEVRIADSLARAEQSIAEQRLLQPEGDNAVYYYRQVLDWTPGHEQALAGLQRVALLYRDLANAAYRRGNFPAALAMIDSGLQVEPQNAELLKMRGEHQALLSSARAARASQASRPALRREAVPQSPPPQEEGNPIKRVWNNLFGN